MNTAPLILLGLGKVGRALVNQIVQARARHADRYRLRLDIVALCDRTGALLAPRGLDDATLMDIVQGKANGTPLRAMERGYYHGPLDTIIAVAGRAGTVVVDCTAGEETIPALLAAQEMGYGLVLANKKPLAADWTTFQRLTHGGRTRYEATVGAGLPVISTLMGLVDTGDTVVAIEGAFSGTLGYLCTALEQGQSFAAAVQRAYDSGYTEPDPRDDLSGMDVARKAVILARTLGWPLTLDDVHTESLYPKAMDEVSASQFLHDSVTLDAPFREQVAQAQARGEVLRYAALCGMGNVASGYGPSPKIAPWGACGGRIT